MRSLNGYIRYVREQQQGKHEYGEHTVRESRAANLFELEGPIDTTPEPPIPNH